MANTDAPPARWQYAIAGIFFLGFFIALAGLQFSNREGTPIVIVAVVSAGAALVTVSLHKLSDFSITAKGVTAKLQKVEEKVDDVKRLQVELVNQLTRDRLSKRFEAYGNLWQCMYPTAIYTALPFGPEQVRGYAEDLSRWYFSPAGGFLLTPEARQVYFPLQGVLGDLGRLSEWTCHPRPNDPEVAFHVFLADLVKEQPHLAEHVKKMNRPETVGKEGWKAIGTAISAKLKSMVENDPQKNAGNAVFVAVQQLSSLLRTVVVQDLQSRAAAVSAPQEGAG